jgi:hypothetical protein
MKISLRQHAATALIAGVVLLGGGHKVDAATVALTSDFQCSAGTAINGIAVGDVTGNSGGSDDCWGTYDGNDPGPGNSFTIGTTEYSFLSKSDNGTTTSDGVDIGLTWSGGSSGTWSIASVLNMDFLLVLKAANSPGYAVWSFFGTSNDSTSGTWDIAWTTGQGGANPDLSHMSIYAAATPIPLPAGVWFLLAGLGGLVAMGRRRKTA